MKWLGTIALIATAIVVAKILLSVDDWSRDWTRNTAELSSDSADESLRPVRRSESLADAQAAVEAFVSQSPGWDLASVVQGPEGTKFHLTRTTRWMRFVDDVKVYLNSETSAAGDVVTVITATSQSRVGKGDLGQNPRNLRELAKFLRSGS